MTKYKFEKTQKILNQELSLVHQKIRDHAISAIQDICKENKCGFRKISLIVVKIGK